MPFMVKSFLFVPWFMGFMCSVSILSDLWFSKPAGWGRWSGLELSSNWGW